MSRLINVDFARLSIATTVQFMDGRPGPQAWSVSVESDGDLDEAGRIFWMDGWTFRLGEGRDLGRELDALDADTAVFAPLVEGDDLSQRLVDELDLAPLGDSLVLINHVQLRAELRGRGGLGRYLTGLAIRELSSGAALVALHASPFELRLRFDGGNVPDDVWEAGAEELGRLWGSLGFRRFRGHIYTFDPTRTALDDAMARLRGTAVGDG